MARCSICFNRNLQEVVEKPWSFQSIRYLFSWKREFQRSMDWFVLSYK